VNKISYPELPSHFKNVLPKVPFLYYVGRKSLIQQRCITVVGTRNISEYGKWVIRELLGSFLKELNIVVVSGLARGVDAYVLRTCLERGIQSIAIVPGGIGSAIPKSNKQIFERVKREGLLLAEYEEGITLRREMFVLRNRLLAAISDDIYVIEAGIKSGSLITANFGLEFGRNIYTIPGNINNNMSLGCNMLARDGAGVIACLDDFKESLGVRNEQVLFKMEME
jgi:DNA processing protein